MNGRRNSRCRVKSLNAFLLLMPLLSRFPSTSLPPFHASAFLPSKSTAAPSGGLAAGLVLAVDLAGVLALDGEVGPGLGRVGGDDPAAAGLGLLGDRRAVDGQRRRGQQRRAPEQPSLHGSPPSAATASRPGFP